MTHAVAPPLTDPAPGGLRRAVARRVADAHREIDDGSLVAFIFGPLSDAYDRLHADIDVAVVFQALPPEETLLDACMRAGASEWFRRARGEGRLVVACHTDGIEAQVRYFDHAALTREIDASLADGDDALHHFGDSILKAEPLAGHAELARLQARLTRLPPQLARAMVKRLLATPTPWRAISQLRDRDAALWCRELQVDACYRLCGVHAALSQRYFTRFQVTRRNRQAPKFENAPEGLAERIERLMEAPPRAAFAQLYALEGEVLAQVAREMPQIDLAAVKAQRAAYAGAPA
jgi:hypothetical protein